MTIIKKICNYCKKDFPESEFGFYRGRMNKSCKSCREYHNWYYNNTDSGRKAKERNKIRYSENKEKFKFRHRNDHLKRKYGLSREDFNAMIKSQDNKCLICEGEFSTVKNTTTACVDHCHKTGKIRGILCRKCNLSLHYIEENNFIEKAQLYLSKIEN